MPRATHIAPPRRGPTARPKVRMPDAAPAGVVRVSLDEPFAPVRLEPPRDRALLVVELGGAAIAELLVPAPGGDLSAGAQREAVERELSGTVAAHRLRAAFTRAARSAEPPAAASVTVVVEAEAGTPRLRSLLSQLETASPPPEVIVLDGAPDGPARDRAIA